MEVSSQTARSGLLLGVPSRKSFQESHHERPRRVPMLKSQVQRQPGLTASPATPALPFRAFKELWAVPCGALEVTEAFTVPSRFSPG